MAPRIVCAAGVTHGDAVFSTLGEVAVLPDTEIYPEALRGAEVLITRSKTRLDRALLDGSPVHFAGTATAGVDHADEAWLKQAGIHFVSAPGCNANSVGEYVCAALLEALPGPLSGCVLGIVGHGNVGRSVATKARALGMQVRLNDPPLAEQGDESGYLELDRVCREADVLSLHVPLIEDGSHPTRRLIGPEQLDLLGPDGWLLNACRGEVVDPDLLHAALAGGRIRGAVLDVWDPEPAFPPDLLERAALGTAHIAGHSFEGKFNGTLQVYDALCRYLDRPGCRADLERRFRSREAGRIPRGELEELDDHAAIARCVRRAYDIRADDRLLRDGLTGDAETRAAWFRELRGSYRRRDEFPAFTVELPPGRECLSGILAALGFRTID